MQPLTTMPAGILIQRGSQNTHLAGVACTTRGLPSRRKFQILGGFPLIQKRQQIYSISKWCFSYAVFGLLALYSPLPFCFTGMLVPAGRVSQALLMLDSGWIQPVGNSGVSLESMSMKRTIPALTYLLCFQKPRNVAVCPDSLVSPT